MRSHRFVNSLLYLKIQLVAKESKAKGNNTGIRRFVVLFLDKCYLSQATHFNVIVYWKMLRQTQPEYKSYDKCNEKQFDIFLPSLTLSMT